MLARVPQELRGQSELPGGKIEEGETRWRSLEREIAEELGAHLRVGSASARTRLWYDSGWASWAVARGGCAQFAGWPARWYLHLEARWVSISELGDLPWIVADLPIVECRGCAKAAGRHVARRRGVGWPIA